MLYFPNRRKNTALWWVAAGVVLVMVAINIAPARGLLQKTFAPIGVGLVNWNSGFKNWLAGWRPSATPLAENETLKQTNSALIAENAQLKMAAEENKSLKQIAGFIEQSPYQLVAARVVGKIQELQGADKIFLIDRGRADGLENGMPVIAAPENTAASAAASHPSPTAAASSSPTNGYLIGKIFQANENWSQVLLITDYNSKIAASVISTDGVLDCVVSGKHGLSLTADFLPINKKISAGDLLVTSGLESLVPRGLLIGAVNEVSTQPGDLFHKVDIKPLGNLNESRLLLVIKNYDQRR